MLKPQNLREDKVHNTARPFGGRALFFNINKGGTMMYVVQVKAPGDSRWVVYGRYFDRRLAEREVKHYKGLGWAAKLVAK